jgi:predicted oxidoreductase
VGTTSVKRMKKSIEAIDIKMDIIDWFLLLEASMGKPLP